MWVHGTSIAVECPDQIANMQRFGFFTRIVGKPNATNWFHFAIPTPVIVDNDRKEIGPVILRFRTGVNCSSVKSGAAAPACKDTWDESGAARPTDNVHQMVISQTPEHSGDPQCAPPSAPRYSARVRPAFLLD